MELPRESPLPMCSQQIVVFYRNTHPPIGIGAKYLKSGKK